MKKHTPPIEPTVADNADSMARLFTFGFDAVFKQTISDLPTSQQHLLGALRRFYAYRHNGFLLVEALDICTRQKVNPPTWVLVALNEGFKKFNKGIVTLEKALHIGKQDRKEYDDYRDQQPNMAKVQRIINDDPKRNISAACKKVANRNGMLPDTLEKQYRKMWLGFYDYIAGR